MDRLDHSALPVKREKRRKIVISHGIPHLQRYGTWAAHSFTSFESLLVPQIFGYFAGVFPLILGWI